MTTYTNTAASIWELVQAIAATSSKKEKEALVHQGMRLPLFERIVKACYDPLTTYGFRELPDIEPFDQGPTLEGLDTEHPWVTIGMLADRTLSGDEARATVKTMMERLPHADMQLFIRIILKDMRAGFTEGTVNRVKPGSILEFAYMRCSLPAKSNMASWDWSVGIISQEKADGMFVNVNVDDRRAHLFTRQGQPLPRESYPALHEAIEQVLADGSQTHGELLVFKDGVLLPREENNGVLNHLNNGGSLAPNQEVRLFAWDQVPLAAVKVGKFDKPYTARLASLLQQVKAGKNPLIGYVDTRIAHSKVEAMAHYREKLRDGKEGTVVKHPDAIWKDGTSKDQVKMKLEVDVDLQVIAIVPGKAHTKNEGRAGSLTCITSDGLLQTDVTVKNEAMRDDVDANPGNWLKKIIKVRANSIMYADEAGELASLFLPRMVEATWRDDKTVADTFQQVCDQFAAAVEAV